MQMVNCDKCKQPISYKHRFTIENKTAFHDNCDDPFGVVVKCDAVEKTLPEFVCEAPQKRAV